MNEELETFIRTYLHQDMAYDTSGYLRPTLFAFKDSYVHAVKQGLSEVLRDEHLTVGKYERLTDIEFQNSKQLYNYLRSMYAYLFEDRPSQPTPPE